MVPSVWSPHEWSRLTATAAYCPLGGAACPFSLSPQHAMVASARRPHDVKPPAADGAVLPDERVGLPVEVVAPARGRAAGEQPARVDVAGRDGGVLPDRRFQLSDMQTVRIAIVAPATDDSVGANPGTSTRHRRRWR